MKKQTKDFSFDLLYNVCFSNTFMCNILQKDYSFTPPHTHTRCHWSLALLHPPLTSPPSMNLSFTTVIFNLIGWF